MSNLEQIAENIFDACEEMSVNFDLTDIDRKNISMLKERLHSADYYEICPEVSKVLVELTNSEKNNPEFTPSVDCKAPSNLCILSIPNEIGVSAVIVSKALFGGIEHIDGYLVFYYFASDGKHNIFNLGAYFMEPWNEHGQHLLVFKKHQSLMKEISKIGYSFKDIALVNIVFACKYFELVNQPRLVKMKPALSRQSRRRMENKYNIPAASWKRVEWDLSKPRYEPQDGKRGGWNMPLHYTRGHWRRAKEHWDNVVRRKDGECYKWIDGFWSGHPAFGIIRSVHAPKIGDADKAKEIIK